jgi:hypothetical protein
MCRKNDPHPGAEVFEALREGLDETVKMPMPAWHLEELQRRALARRDGGGKGIPRPEVKTQAAQRPLLREFQDRLNWFARESLT